MLKTLILAVAVNLQELPLDVIESFYWDCDTMFMKGELGGQDTWTCLKLTEEFQKHFKNREEFMRYWEQNRIKQWQQRGYTAADS